MAKRITKQLPDNDVFVDFIVEDGKIDELQVYVYEGEGKIVIGYQNLLDKVKEVESEI